MVSNNSKSFNKLFRVNFFKLKVLKILKPGYKIRVIKIIPSGRSFNRLVVKLIKGIIIQIRFNGMATSVLIQTKKLGGTTNRVFYQFYAFSRFVYFSCSYRKIWGRVFRKRYKKI
jgi:hypothetical protein